MAAGCDLTGLWIEELIYECFLDKDLAGISPSSAGYRTILVHPKVVGDLTSARASIESIRGTAAVEWSVEEERFSMNLTVPAGVVADVKVPVLTLHSVVIAEGGNTIWEGGAYVHGVPGISHGKKMSEDTISFSVGSGSYEFLVFGSRG